MSNSVLILNGQAVQTLIAAESLHKSGYEVSVLCDGKDNYGYHSRYAKYRYVGPDSHNQDEYIKFLLPFIEERHFDVVIPMDDGAAIVASKFKNEINKISKVLIPDYEIFLRGYDKNRLMSLCRDKKYPHPLTLDLSKENLLTSEPLRQFPYPGLIKPNFTSGARGMTMINTYEEFTELYPAIKEKYGECHFQRFIEPGGRQIELQIFIDKNKEPLYSSVIWKQRYYPVNGGSSCCNVTIDSPEIVEVCTSILKDIQWVGFADFDLVEDPIKKELLILELNPRIPACIKSVIKSGIDYPTIIADATLDRPIKKYFYHPGKRLRHLGLDVLWFLKSPDRFRANPSWFKFFGKDLYYQDLSCKDFVPFICGIWGNIKKQLNPEFRKSKSGI